MIEDVATQIPSTSILMVSIHPILSKKHNTVDPTHSNKDHFTYNFLVSEDHAIGLSTFTIMAGLGGSMGYAMGAIDWGVLGTELIFVSKGI